MIFYIKEFNDAVVSLKTLNTLVGQEIKITHYGWIFHYREYTTIPEFEGVFLGIDEISLNYKILQKDGSVFEHNIFFEAKKHQPASYAFTKLEF